MILCDRLDLLTDHFLKTEIEDFGKHNVSSHFRANFSTFSLIYTGFDLQSKIL